MDDATRRWIWVALGGLGAAILFAAGLAVAPLKTWHRRNRSSTAQLLLFVRSETGSTRTAKLIMRYSEEYEIDTVALLAMVWRESKFNPNASGVRPSGYMGAGDSDRGLLGLYWKTACDIAEHQWKDKELARKIRHSPAILYQPDLNMDLGACNLRRLLDDHPSVHDIWDAYKFHNSGDKGKGSLENVTAVKDRYWKYRRKLAKFDWRKAR